MFTVVTVDRDQFLVYLHTCLTAFALLLVALLRMSWEDSFEIVCIAHEYLYNIHFLCLSILIHDI